MHFSTTIASVILAASGCTALALPITPSNQLIARAFTKQPDDPSMTPVNVKDLAKDATMTCGSTTFSWKDILQTISWGEILERENLGRGAKSDLWPTGRFPHSNDEARHVFNGNCPADGNRMTYPLIKDGPYNGGPRNKKWGDHRVVWYSKGEEAADANPIVYFCGGLTHEDAPGGTGDLKMCTVN
ncbi:unnamed protein product [Zymoseptoria tritici ST99CH_1E4]|nr:unnamed protein product [Zymoseptoria tritici ST99CH_1E4]